jgi:hypothetical protein
MPTKQEIAELCGLHRPPAAVELLNTLHVRQIKPTDISSRPGELCQEFASLFGDPELGDGNLGDCPSWCGDWNWYKKFLEQYQV